MAKSGKGKLAKAKKGKRLAILEAQVCDLLIRVHELETFLNERFAPEPIIDPTVVIDADADPDAN